MTCEAVHVRPYFFGSGLTAAERFPQRSSLLDSAFDAVDGYSTGTRVPKM